MDKIKELQAIIDSHQNLVKSAPKVEVKKVEE